MWDGSVSIPQMCRVLIARPAAGAPTRPLPFSAKRWRGRLGSGREDSAVRLIGFRIPAEVTSGADQYLELTPLSILCGRNDVGKSRILTGATNLVRHRPLGDGPVEGWVAYVDLEAPADGWLDEASGVDDATRFNLVPTDTSLFGLSVSSRLDAVGFKALISDRRYGLARLSGLRAMVGLDEARWDPLFDELSSSRVASLRPTPHGWALDWCLPASIRTHPQLSALIDLGVPVSDFDREPVTVAPLFPWFLPGVGLPLVQSLPGELEDRVALIAHAVDEGASLREHFVTLFLEALVAARLPPFLRGEYEPRLSADRGDVTFVRGSGQSLSVEDMASGYRLWCELAVRSGSTVARQAIAQIKRIRGNEGSLPDVPELHMLQLRAGGELPVTEEHLHVLAAHASELAAQWTLETSRSYAGAHKFEDLTLALAHGLPPRPLFVVDEPEQHLHPRLERQAAEWLTSAGQTLGADVLAATHSPAFLSLGAPAGITMVLREAGATALIPLDADTLEKADLVSSELGLNRGEIAAYFRLFLFVEGEVDRLVLDTLYGDRLRAARVAVLRLHGSSGAGAVVDSEMLLRFFDQPIALLLDNLDASRLRGADAAELDKIIARGPSDEMKQAARVRKNALFAEVGVEVLGIPGPDIIFELDEDELRARQELNYPGHDVTREAWTASGQTSWKKWCVRNGLLDDSPDAIRPVVEAMRVRGHLPRSLEPVVARIEALSRESSGDAS